MWKWAADANAYLCCFIRIVPRMINDKCYMQTMMKSQYEMNKNKSNRLWDGIEILKKTTLKCNNLLIINPCGLTAYDTEIDQAPKQQVY